MSRSVLAFGAHPDDVEFGAGGVLARETAAGARVHIVVGSRGEAASSGTPAEREAESRAAAALLGATVEFIELGGDCHIESTPAQAIRLAQVIRRVRPQVVLATSPVENQHPDHAAMGRLVRDAARLARYGGVQELHGEPAHAIELLLFFGVTSDGEPAGQLPLYFDVSSVVDVWTRAMEAHATQARSRDYVDLQLTRARLNGARAGVSHAIALYPSDPLVFASLEGLRGARRY